MSVEDNKALVRRSIEGENRADLGMVEDCYATNYVHHDPDNPAVQDWLGLKQSFLGYFAAFPDGYVVIDDLIAEGDKVVKRWTSRGSHQGEFAGIPATGKQVSFTGTTYACAAPTSEPCSRTEELRATAHALLGTATVAGAASALAGQWR